MNKLLAFAAVIGAADCCQAAPVPRTPPPPDHFMPTVVGTEWVRTSGGHEQRETIVSAEESPDGKIVTVAYVFDGGSKEPYIKFILSPSGLFSELLDWTHHKHQCVKLPLVRGSEWSCKNGSREVQVKYLGDERVTVPAGKYEAAKFELVPSITDRDSEMKRSTVWIARGVGIVKVESKDYVEELKSFHIPK